LCASFGESVIGCSLKFLAVIGISIIDLIRTLGNDSVYEKASGAVLGFIGENIGIQLPGEIIDRYKQVLARFTGGLSF